MSDSFFAFYTVKIKISLSELALSGFVTKSSESRFKCVFFVFVFVFKP